MKRPSLRDLIASRVGFLVALSLAVAAAMASLSEYFFTLDNLLGMTQFGAVLALVALGQTLVILAGGGGIDLSVGAIVSLSGVVMGLLVKAGVNVWAAGLACVAVGALLGAVNGFTITWIGLPPLIATLGTMYAFGALALVVTDGLPVSGFPESFAFLGQGYILKVPVQVLLVVIPVFVLMQYAMTRTRWGREVYLVGVNQQAAQLAGISVRGTRFAVYMLSGALAGLGAVVTCSWLLTARPDVGSGLELQSITVTVLGGTSIFGGQGSLSGSMLAVLIVTMIASGLQLANVNTIWQLALLGIILLAAVAGNETVVARMSGRRGLKS